MQTPGVPDAHIDDARPATPGSADAATGEPGPAEILVLRAIKLGDILVAVPALRAIRRAHPDARISLATTGWLAPVVKLLGMVDEHLPQQGFDHPIAREPGTVDLAINLHGAGIESRALLHELRAHRTLGHAAPELDGMSAADGPAWEDHVLERYRWARLVSWHGMPADPEDVGILVPAEPPVAEHAVVIHVGAAYGSRQWPVDRFAEVARALADEGRTVVFTGSDKERERALEVAAIAGMPTESVLAGELALDAFAGIIAAADLVISADTGAAHLATAYGIPSVVIFGPAPPEEWGPPASGPHIVLTDATQRLGDTVSAIPDPALLAIASAHVLEAARSLDGHSVIRPLTGEPRD
ncbi:glycosyltransferase family 9 protein [Clavibacter michiganensis]|uniref:glycosyltransferase family 9 protein n=1 Tax=Clavibacter michiganensis TaxID=28447 RepID=UPI002930542F|nr:glycosyltransferase family 9 protein [Clavibacter michiganensis]